MREITEIIIHCTATRGGINYTPDDVRKWHKARGFADVGYHYIIGINGEIWKGRSLSMVGAHCVGHNAKSIGVCYVGGLDPVTEKPTDTRTPQQREALARLLKVLHLNYPAATLHAHFEFAKKACPCFAVSEYNYIFS